MARIPVLKLDEGTRKIASMIVEVARARAGLKATSDGLGDLLWGLVLDEVPELATDDENAWLTDGPDDGKSVTESPLPEYVWVEEETAARLGLTDVRSEK